MLAVLTCIVVLAVTGLGFFALHQNNTGRLRVQAGVWRLITLSIEVGQGGDPPAESVPGQASLKLPATEKPKELEAGNGDRGPSATSADDQSDAA